MKNDDDDDVPGSSTTVRQPTPVEDAPRSSTPFVVLLVVDCPGSFSILEKPSAVDGVLGSPTLSPGVSPSPHWFHNTFHQYMRTNGTLT